MPFFVHTYAIKKEHELVTEKEMNYLEQLGIIKKGITVEEKATEFL